MSALDPSLAVRAGALYVAGVATLALWAMRRLTSREWTGALLGFIWNVPALLAVNAVALRQGWWQFGTTEGTLLGIPVDLYLAWAWLWGGVAPLAWPAAPWPIVAVGALLADVVLMPLTAPVVQLGSGWLWGESAALLVCLLPGVALARFTAADTRLGTRVSLQIAAFSGLMLFVLPAMIAGAHRGAWIDPRSRPLWQLSLIVQLLALPAAVGLSAVQEFAIRGHGTPLPFDPPRRMVTSGLYAYIRNPMQLSAVALLVGCGAAVANIWLALAGVMAHLYSAGLAGWDEDGDLRSRFGDQWTAYRAAVRRWVPHVRPWHDPGAPPARLYVAENCGMCREVARWFDTRAARHLTIVPAETHPSGALRRITYEAADGRYRAAGIEAVARALEHIHLGWAVVGCIVRLPPIAQVVQLLADASGAGPRDIRSSAGRQCDTVSAPASPR